MNVNEMYKQIHDESVPTADRIGLARDIIDCAQKRWCPNCKDWRLKNQCFNCGTETTPCVDQNTLLGTLSQLGRMLEIRLPSLSVTDWIEVDEGQWVNLARAGRIWFRESTIQIDGVDYRASAETRMLVSRWVHGRAGRGS